MYLFMCVIYFINIFYGSIVGTLSKKDFSIHTLFIIYVFTLGYLQLTGQIFVQNIISFIYRCDMLQYRFP